MNWIKELLSGSTEGLGKGIGDVVAKFKADPTKVIELESDLEKLKITHDESMAKLSNDLEVEFTKRIEIQGKENESARNREIQIATSNASWITRNTTAVLALSFVGTTLALYTLSILKAVEIHENILRDLRDIVILIMGYYFGSSLGSKDKQEQLNKLSK